MRVLTGRFCIVRTVNSYSLVNIQVQQISAALCVLNQYLCVHQTEVAARRAVLWSERRKLLLRIP